MKNLIHSRKFYAMVLLDGGFVFAAYYLAFYLRFDGQIPEGYLATFRHTVLQVVVTKLIIFFVFNLYRGMWRFTGLTDLKNIFAASLVSSLVITSYFLFLYQFIGYPRSVYVIDFILTLMFIGGIRVSVRLALKRGSGLSGGRQEQGRDQKRIMVLGANYTGEKVVREMLDSPEMRMKPVSFLDDDSGKNGKTIHGVPVRGSIGELGKFSSEFDEILIAIPSVKGTQLRKIVSVCEQTGKRFRIMASISELIGGQITVKAIRDVRFEDLMGRDEVRLDVDLLSRGYKGKRILITGAGGSIGSELVRQVAQYSPSSLALLDFSEFNLFQIENKTRRQFEFIPLKSYLADIRHAPDLQRVFAEFKPEVVFHTAAYKHVPMQELNPWEAVFNNIQGTRNLAMIAREAGVERFVLVSTDKAVRPTNIMGATKRVAEMFIECMNSNSGDMTRIRQNSGSCPRNYGNDHACRFVAVRFGNVLGSSGSVIPLFEEQIAARMPVTVTHPEVMRFFMSIAEAAQLITQAGAMGEGGEIFILDMGKPVKIADMARDLIRLHGLNEGDVPIMFVGLRPGEKLYEELITEGEGIVPTTHEKIRVLRGRNCSFDKLTEQIEALIRAAQAHDAVLIKSRLKDIVPEYTPQ